MPVMAFQKCQLSRLADWEQASCWKHLRYCVFWRGFFFGGGENSLGKWCQNSACCIHHECFTNSTRFSLFYLPLSNWKRPSSWRPNPNLFQLPWYLYNPYYTFQETAKKVEKFRGTKEICQGWDWNHHLHRSGKFAYHHWCHPVFFKHVPLLCWFCLAWDGIWINLCEFSWKGSSGSQSQLTCQIWICFVLHDASAVRHRFYLLFFLISGSWAHQKRYSWAGPEQSPHKSRVSCQPLHR